MQTGVNIINNYVGMVLLSMSYCYVSAGWLALPVLILLTGFGCYTGALIVMSYTTIARQGETVPSYAKIGECAWGGFGKWLVLIASIVETYFAIVNMNVIIWKNAVLLLPNCSPNVVVIGCIALSLPTNWLRNFSLLSFLSMFGLLCVAFICVVVGYQLLSAEPAQVWGVEHTLSNVGGVPMAASIMLAGLTGD